MNVYFILSNTKEKPHCPVNNSYSHSTQEYVTKTPTSTVREYVYSSSSDCPVAQVTIIILQTTVTIMKHKSNLCTIE